MARPLKWPHVYPRLNAGGTTTYVVDGGLVPLAGGVKKRQRFYYKTKKDAEAKAHEMRNQREKLGTAVTEQLSVASTELKKCMALIQASDLGSLEDVVRLAIQAKAGLMPSNQAPKEKPRVVEEESSKDLKLTGTVIDEYANHLRWKNRNKPHHDNKHATIVRGVLRKALGAQLAVPMAAVTLQNLKDALSKVTERSAHKVQSTIQTFFRFATEEGRRYLTEDVSMGLGKASKPPADDDEDEPEMLALWEVKALLYTAQSLPEFHELIPPLSVQLYQGLRLSETGRLPPLELDLSLDEVKLGAGVAKREARRSPEYHPVLKSWLKAYPPTQPKLVPPEYHKKLRKLRQAAGLVRGKFKPQPDVCPKAPQWERSILRHTYGSNFYGFTQDKQKTLYNMGHTGPRTFFKHYAACVKKRHAEEYWSILPLNETELAAWIAQKSNGKTLSDVFPNELGITGTCA